MGKHYLARTSSVHAQPTMLVAQSDKKPNPFDTPPKGKSKPNEKLPKALSGNQTTPLATFNEYRKSRRLELIKGLTPDDASEYRYNPYKGGGTIETCEEFRHSLNIPKDYPIVICQDDDNRTMAPTNIDANDLEKFVGFKK